MIKRRILSLLLGVSIISTNIIILGNTTTVSAATTKQTNKIQTVKIIPNIAGIVTITSINGASLRATPSDSGYLVGTASYGQELDYAGQTATDSSGVKWYKVVLPNNSSTAWVSSQVSRLG
ncbi:MAG: SH3 domain-containing protein [Bacillota bacterium]|nr:SH3 domain-containing protein [Bacillota bacterium]